MPQPHGAPMPAGLRLPRLTALALARAALAGRPGAAGIAARWRECLGADAPWQVLLAERLSRFPGEHWRRLTVRSLASWIERDAAYLAAWHGEHPPTVRRLLLHEPKAMQPLPVGLERCTVPDWPHAGAMAAALGVGTAGLWRLTLPAARQRRAALAEQHYTYRLLAKRAGGWRLLEVPQPHLKALQRRLLDMLLDRIPPHESAYGYCRERSVLDHAAAHAGQPVLLHFDLQDFFGSVRASRVHALFRTLGYGDEVARDLTALCTTATPEPVLQRLTEDGGLAWAHRQRLRGAHLPQGAPTSPALANLCAFRLDLRLDGLAWTLGARYTRYADDLVFSGGRGLHAARERVETWVGRIAREEGFVLNHRKTHCQRAGRRQTVCGVVVNRHPNLARADFERLKALLHQCVLHGPASQNRAGHVNWREHLTGRVAWASQLNPDKAARLRRWFERIDWTR